MRNTIILNPLRLIEIFIVKLKIKRFVFADNQIALTIKINNQLPNPQIARISKTGRNSYRVELDGFQLTYTSKGNARAALNSIIHYLLTKEADTPLVYADLSDGGHDIPAEQNIRNLSFCSNASHILLIPDHHFTSNKGYLAIRKFVMENKIDWKERKNGFLWRGSTSGIGLVYAEPFEFSNEALLPRVRMCLKLAKYPDADVAIAANYVLEKNMSEFEKLTKNKTAKEPIPQNAWLAHKFAIDIDGNTNAWQNFFCRMLMGCCVIKVESFQNFRQWYYDQLKPWVHFVPVKADMSDFIEKLDWCKSHDKECEQIASQAQALAFQIAEKEFPVSSN